MPFENAQRDTKQTDFTQRPESGLPRLISEFVRLGSLGLGVATTAIIPEYLVDHANHSALKKSRGHKPPLSAWDAAAGDNATGMKGKGIAYLAIKSALRILGPLPAKIISSSNKNGVRRGTEISKENIPQEKQAGVSDEQVSTHPEKSAQNREAVWRENALWGSVIVQFGLAEALITGKTSLYAAHKTEVANFNPSFKVINAPKGWSIDDLMKRMHYRSTGMTTRTIRNSSQIVMFPVCAFIKNKLSGCGVDSYTSSLAASTATGVTFSPYLTLLHFVYREQAISMNPTSFKTISTLEAIKKIPLDFVKKAFWGRTAATNAAFSVAMLTIVNGVEQTIDFYLMPAVHEKLHQHKDSFTRAQKDLSLFKTGSDKSKKGNTPEPAETSHTPPRPRQ